MADDDQAPPLPAGYKIQDSSPTPSTPKGDDADDTPPLPSGYKIQTTDVATGGAEGNPGTPPPDKPGMTPLDSRPTYGSSLGDVVSTVGSHLKNAVVGPVEAIAEPPQNVGERVADSLAGPGTLAAYRMAVEPSIAPAQSAFSKFKSGDFSGGLRDAESAIPIVGPWADQVEKDVREKGAVAGLAGLGTDILAAKGAGRAFEGAGSAFKSRMVPVPGENFTPIQQSAFSGVLARAPGMGDNFIPQDVAGGAGSTIRQAAADNPELVQAVHSGTPQDAMGATQAILDEAKKTIDVQHQTALAPVSDQPADMSPVTSKVTFPNSLSKFAPEDAEAIKDLRTRLASVKTLGGMNDLRMWLNNELSPDFRKTQAANARSGAVDGALRSALKATRDAYYDQLKKATGQDFSGLKRTEGSIISAKEALQKSASGLTKREALATEPKSARALAADALQGGRTIHGGPVAGTANLVAERVLGQTPMAQVQSGLQRFFSNLPEPSTPRAANVPTLTAPKALPANVPGNAEVGGPPTPPAPFTGGPGPVPSVITPEPMQQPRLPAQAGPSGSGVPPPPPLVAAPPPEPRTIPLPAQAGQAALPPPSGTPDFVRPPASPSPPLDPATAATGTRAPLAPNPTPAMPTGMTATPEGIRVNRPQLPAPPQPPARVPVAQIENPPMASPKGKAVNIGDEVRAKGQTGRVTGINPKTGKVIVKWSGENPAPKPSGQVVKPAVSPTAKQPTLYHGHGRGANSILSSGEGGMWVSDNPEMASTFGPTVSKVSVGNPRIFDASTRDGYQRMLKMAGDSGVEMPQDFDKSHWDAIRSILKFEGYDGINIGETHMDGANDIWLFDRHPLTPTKLK